MLNTYSTEMNGWWAVVGADVLLISREQHYDRNSQLIGEIGNVIEEAFDLAETGLFPGGSFRNERFCSQHVNVINKQLSKSHVMLMYDAQTSGGLLIAIKAEKAKELLNTLVDAGLEWCKIIGTVKPKGNYQIEIV